MHKSIGVIDSGIGGLTVAKEIMKLLPNEHIIYFGDTARCPYGSLPKEQIVKNTFEVVDFLLTKNIKALVIACNTITAYVLNILRRELTIPVIGVIQPSVRKAIQQTKTDHIGIIGTEATVHSQSYEINIQKVNQNIRATSIACPMFVPYVEKGIFTGKDLDQIVQLSLKDIKQRADLDTLILGCTHFPLLEKTIQKVVGDSIKLIAPSKETARDIKVMLIEENTLNINNEQAIYQFYTTGQLNKFQSLIHKIIPNDLMIGSTIKSNYISLTKIKEN